MKNRGIFRLLLLFVLVQVGLRIASLNAEPMPRLPAEDLAGNPVSLPDTFSGKATLLVIDFSRGSATQTNAWMQKLSGVFDIYSVVVLEAVPKVARPAVLKSMRKDVPAELQNRVIVIQQGSKDLKSAVAFDRPNDAYLLLLDRDGSIHYRYHGPATDEAFNQLKTAAFVQLAE
jgi:hypothetical protein